MRNLIITTILFGAGAALATPGPEQPTQPRLAGTVAEEQLIANLRELAAPAVTVSEDFASIRAARRGPPPQAIPAETEEAAAEVLVVAPEALNLRAAPSTDSAVLGRLVQGQSVEVSGRENGWAQVADSSGTVGWAYGEFLVAGN
jgi:uncharacterized protein YgiM (DUF1202 family)